MSSLPSQTLLFIPAYRCEKQITRVLSQITERVQRLIHTIIVVDNRSPDSTVQASIKYGKTHISYCNFIVWQNDENYGLGGSHKAAIRYGIEHGFDYLIVLHGDDQADIADLVPLLEKGEHFNTDCLLGSRFMPGSRLQGYSWFRNFGNRVYNLLFSLVVMKNITDLGSGLNVYRLSALNGFYYKRFPDNLTFNYVMLLAGYNRKQTVRFFPISWREEDQISNVKLFRQALQVLRLLSGYFLRRGAFLASEMRTTPFEQYSGKILHQQPPVARQDNSPTNAKGKA